MINPDHKLPEPERRVYEPMPDNVYQAQLVDVDLKQNRKFKSDEEETRLQFTFVIIEEGPYYGRRVWEDARQIVSLRPKTSKLYDLIKSLTGKTFTEEECKRYTEIVTPEFLNGMIGTQKRLALTTHVSQTGNKSNKIQAIMPVTAELPPYDETKVKNEQ